MKKSILIALAAAMTIGSQVAAAQDEMVQDAVEEQIVYVDDPSQGLLINPMYDNWFITGEVGANVYFSQFDDKRKFTDRFAPAFSVFAGKWFTPQFGARVGINFVTNKGLTDLSGYIDETSYSGLYKERWNHVGPVFDLMANLTNIICGYKEERFYNLTFYVGAGGYLSFSRNVTKNADGSFNRTGYKYSHDNVITLRTGLLNQFRLNKRLQLNLDLRWTPVEAHMDETGANRIAHAVQLYAGATYNFGHRINWAPPVEPVISEEVFENCNVLRIRLEAADARIADLEDQLNECLRRPNESQRNVDVASQCPLTTLYYPINVSKLTQREINVLEAIADVMKENTDTKYVITGWADNYTGNDVINTRLRKARAEGVERQLIKFGVDKSQLKVTINSGNLYDLGEKYVALDRAVTIEEED